MKNLVVILVLAFALKTSAQNYDLVVKTNGDSIACHIDSVTDSKLFLEMMFNKVWIHTDIPRSDISDYQYNVIDKKLVVFMKGTSYIKKMEKPKEDFVKSNYGCRYFFAPSAFGMKKGTKTYTHHDLFVQDFQFGISNKFSISTGTSVFLTPVYVMPIYTYQINDKSALAVGDLFIFTTYGDFNYGNLLFGLYTRGNLDNNFTIGAGLWTSKLGTDEVETIDPGMDPPFTEYRVNINTISPAFNFSAQIKLSERTQFVTENFWFKIKMDAIAHLRDPVSDYILRSEHYAMEETVLAGILGLRFINKKNPARSWQFSSIYVLAHHGKIPDEYKLPDWETYNREGKYTFFPIPLISFTRRF